MFLRASFLPSPLDISRCATLTVHRDYLKDYTALTGQGNPGFAKEENSRGSVVPLSRMRLGKPGFIEHSRECETAEHD